MTRASYNVVLVFAENENLQFPDDGSVMTYNIPDGLEVLNNTVGKFTIKVNDGGTVYSITDNQYTINDGILTFNFNASDPNIGKLKAASNLKFTLSFDGKIKENASKISFKSGIEKDLDIDTSNSVTATKSATFDKANNKVNYEVAVKSEGVSKNVVVKDTISGTALSLDSGSFNIYSSLTWDKPEGLTGGATENSFQYTIPEMKNGEIVTFKYSANIDVSQIPKVDGKYITVGNNRVEVNSDGEPTPSVKDVSTTIDYTPVVTKGNGIIGEDGKTLTWTIVANEDCKVSMAGGTITDKIADASSSIMKYSGIGIKVEVFDASGTSVRTENVAWSSLSAKTDSSWTYVIPNDTTPYKYVITYTTEVDTTGKTDQVTVNNSVTTDGGKSGSGSSTVTPAGGEVKIYKNVNNVDVDNKEITWDISFTVPAEGLTKALLKDVTERREINGKQLIEEAVKGSISVIGLITGEENYDITYNENTTDINFYYTDNGQKKDGLKGSGAARTINVTIKTKIDNDWLNEYSNTKNTWWLGHTNNVSLDIDGNVKTASATAQAVKSSIEKKSQYSGTRTVNGVELPVYEYNIILNNVTSDVNVIEDKFDTELLEAYEPTSGDPSYWGWTVTNAYRTVHMDTKVSYVYTADGIKITTSPESMPHDPNSPSGFYPQYRITYYLTVKDEAALLKISNKAGSNENGKYTLSNEVEWNDSKDGADVDYTYEGLTKEILTTDDQLKKTDEDIWADFRITLNPGALMLNNGDPLKMTDTLTNLSIDYNSIVAIPSTGVTWDESDSRVTFIIPDATKVVVTYRARVIFSDIGSSGETKNVSFSNVAEMEGYRDDINKTAERHNSGSGVASVPVIKLLKYQAGNMTNTLVGAVFQLLDSNKNPILDKNGAVVTFTTSDGSAIDHDGNLIPKGQIIVRGDQNSLGWALSENTRYYLREIQAPAGYMLSDFDYSFQISSDGTTDYSQYIYHTGDTMSAKNYPGTYLTVNKVWTDGNEYHNSDSVTIKLQQRRKTGENTWTEWSDTIREEVKSGSSYVWQDIASKTLVLNAENNWTANFPRLPAVVPADLSNGNADDVDVEYQIVETLVNGEAVDQSKVQIVKNSDTAYNYTVTNTYDRTSFAPEVKKSMKQGSHYILQGSDFEFGLYEINNGVDGITPIKTAKNAADGTVKFEAVDCSAKTDGVYKYAIKEILGANSGFANDTIYELEVTVRDDKVTNLEYKKRLADGTMEAVTGVPEFVNEEVTSISVLKEWEGYTPKDGDYITVALYRVTTTPEPVQTTDITVNASLFESDGTTTLTTIPDGAGITVTLNNGDSALLNNTNGWSHTFSGLDVGTYTVTATADGTVLDSVKIEGDWGSTASTTATCGIVSIIGRKRDNSSPVNSDTIITANLIIDSSCGTMSSDNTKWNVWVDLYNLDSSNNFSGGYINHGKRVTNGEFFSTTVSGIESDVTKNYGIKYGLYMDSSVGNASDYTLTVNQNTLTNDGLGLFIDGSRESTTLNFTLTKNNTSNKTRINYRLDVNDAVTSSNWGVWVQVFDEDAFDWNTKFAQFNLLSDGDTNSTNNLDPKRYAVQYGTWGLDATYQLATNISATTTHDNNVMAVVDGRTAAENTVVFTLSKVQSQQETVNITVAVDQWIDTNGQTVASNSDGWIWTKIAYGSESQEYIIRNSDGWSHTFTGIPKNSTFTIQAKSKNDGSTENAVKNIKFNGETGFGGNDRTSQQYTADQNKTVNIEGQLQASSSSGGAGSDESGNTVTVQMKWWNETNPNTGSVTAKVYENKTNQSIKTVTLSSQNDWKTSFVDFEHDVNTSYYVDLTYPDNFSVSGISVEENRWKDDGSSLNNYTVTINLTYINNTSSIPNPARFAFENNMRFLGYTASTTGAAGDPNFTNSYEIPTNAELIDTQILTKDNKDASNDGWSYVWSDLPKYDENGNKIYYYVKEIGAKTDGDSVSASQSVTMDDNETDRIKITTITNTVTKLTGSLKVKKVVEGNPSPVPTYRIGVHQGSTWFKQDGTVALTEEERYITFSAGEEKTWTNLPVGTYTVTEVDAPVTGYALSATGSNVSVAIKNGEITSHTITNTYTELTSFRVTKRWMDSSTNWNPNYGTTVYFKLAKEKDGTIEIIDTEKRALTADTKITVAEADLGNAKDTAIAKSVAAWANGNGTYSIPYSMEIDNLPVLEDGWSYTAVECDENGNPFTRDLQYWTCNEFAGSSAALALKNNLVDIYALKDWQDEGNAGREHPTVTFQLYRKEVTVVANQNSIEETLPTTVDAATTAGYTAYLDPVTLEKDADSLDGKTMPGVHWDNLPKYNIANGKQYLYLVVETNSGSITGYNLETVRPQGTDIVFVNKLETVEIEVTKAWTGTMPEGATVTLTLTSSEGLSIPIVLNGKSDYSSTFDAPSNWDVNTYEKLDNYNDKAHESGAWHATWYRLPKYDSNGAEIAYTVTETEAPVGWVAI